MPCGTVRMQRECQGYREQQGGYVRTHHIMARCSVRQHGRCGERFSHLQFVTLVRQARPATMARLGDSHFARAAVAWVAQFWTGVRALWSLSPADKVAGLTPGLRCCACWRHTILLAGTKPSARCESSLLSQRLSWRGDARPLTCWHSFWAACSGERVARQGAGVDPVCKVAATGQPPVQGNHCTVARDYTAAALLVVLLQTHDTSQVVSRCCANKHCSVSVRLRYTCRRAGCTT